MRKSEFLSYNLILVGFAKAASVSGFQNSRANGYDKKTSATPCFNLSKITLQLTSIENVLAIPATTIWRAAYPACLFPPLPPC